MKKRVLSFVLAMILTISSLGGVVCAKGNGMTRKTSSETSVLAGEGAVKAGDVVYHVGYGTRESDGGVFLAQVVYAYNVKTGTVDETFLEPEFCDEWCYQNGQGVTGLVYAEGKLFWIRNEIDYELMIPSERQLISYDITTKECKKIAYAMDTQVMQIKNGKIYYSANDGNRYQMNLDGTGKKRFLKDYYGASNTGFYYYYLGDNKIVLFDANNSNLYTMNYDGTGKKTIAKNINLGISYYDWAVAVESFFISGKRVYWYELEKNETTGKNKAVYYSAKINGKGKKKISTMTYRKKAMALDKNIRIGYGNVPEVNVSYERYYGGQQRCGNHIFYVDEYTVYHINAKNEKQNVFYKSDMDFANTQMGGVVIKQVFSDCVLVENWKLTNEGFSVNESHLLDMNGNILFSFGNAFQSERD